MKDIAGETAVALFFAWVGVIVFSGMALMTFAMVMAAITAIKVVM